MRVATLIAGSVIALLAVPAHATTVSVQINATVEYNQVSFGNFGNVNPGDNVLVQFNVDSNDFLNSGSFNTRGYVIDQSSFVLVMGSVVSGLQNPFPAGVTPYFVLRESDPVADGFFLSTGPDLPVPLPLNEPGGLDPFFGLRIEVGYNGSELSSLDILDATGTHDFTNLTSFYTVVADAFAEPIGLIFDSLTISAPVSVEAGTWGNIKALYR
ncbi:MAG: hypothetical protein DHS20C21_14900 [Gemmatimonadota bacterium]|nr:MAG: hypothetical protein DHS20C21_14900 [Gemmatimonadota bacterium]